MYENGTVSISENVVIIYSLHSPGDGMVKEHAFFGQFMSSIAWHAQIIVFLVMDKNPKYPSVCSFACY
jgi:hypothetical protein